MINQPRTVTEQLPLEHETPRWYAFRTMYKREKAIARRFEKAGIECYVPLMTVVRHYKSKTKTLHIPLLSSYIFVKLKAKQYSEVLADVDIFEIVKFQGEVGRVTDEEIAFLKTVLGEEVSKDYEVNLHKGLVEGTPVVISGGALAGTKGKIVDVQGNRQFIVELQGIGVALRLTVAKNSLASIPAYAL